MGYYVTFTMSSHLDLMLIICFMKAFQTCSIPLQCSCTFILVKNSSGYDAFVCSAQPTFLCLHDLEQRRRGAKALRIHPASVPRKELWSTFAYERKRQKSHRRRRSSWVTFLLVAKSDWPTLEWSKFKTYLMNKTDHYFCHLAYQREGESEAVICHFRFVTIL